MILTNDHFYIIIFVSFILTNDFNNNYKLILNTFFIFVYLKFVYSVCFSDM